MHLDDVGAGADDLAHPLAHLLGPVDRPGCGVRRKVVTPDGSQPSPWPPVWLSALIEICSRGPSTRPSATARCTPRSAPPASRTVVMPQSSVAARLAAAWKNW